MRGRIKLPLEDGTNLFVDPDDFIDIQVIEEVKKQQQGPAKTVRTMKVAVKERNSFGDEDFSVYDVNLTPDEFKKRLGEAKKTKD